MSNFLICFYSLNLKLKKDTVNISVFFFPGQSYEIKLKKDNVNISVFSFPGQSYEIKLKKLGDLSDLQGKFLRVC